MNRLFKLLGIRGREYRGSDFSVQIEPIAHEVVSVIYTRDSANSNFSADRFGRKGEILQVAIPHEMDLAEACHIVRDLEIAFVAMGYAYVIARKPGIEGTSDTSGWETLAKSKQH